MKTAQFFRRMEDGRVHCVLCPHECKLNVDHAGKCGVRRNINGELIAETYQKVSALHLDPIEKKPLYHFYPGNTILSIGSIGCNLSCSFCQNCDISQSDFSLNPMYKDYPVDDIVRMARDYPDNIGISFTYNEPTMSYEYIMEIARLSMSVGLKTTMVSNGFINADPLIRLLPFIDAFNIDLKAFHDDFYREQTNASLYPVLETLKILHQSGKHLEVTNLVIPGLNDDRELFAQMVDWIATELGKSTVLHISRFFPHHRLKREPTPVETLFDLYRIARRKLHFVYLGNMVSDDGQNTKCPECGQVVISRNRYDTQLTGLSQKGSCTKCGHLIENLIL